MANLNRELVELDTNLDEPMLSSERSDLQDSVQQYISPQIKNSINSSQQKRTTGRFNNFLIDSNKGNDSIIRLDVIHKQKSVQQAEIKEEVDSRINPLADSDPEI